jgi:hypothetical protein
MAPPSKKAKKVSTLGSYSISDTAKKTSSSKKTTHSKKVGRPIALKERKKRMVSMVLKIFLIYLTSKVGTILYLVCLTVPMVTYCR